MKFLTVPRLQKLSALMQAIDVGDRLIHARVEAYSCKLAGTDKRAAKEITGALDASLSSHTNQYFQSNAQSSNLGDLHESSTKHLLVSLITTLNASFPDYDFSNLRPDDFQRDPSPQVAMETLNSLFLTAVGSSLQTSGFRQEFWSALEETVNLHECEIYRYEPNEDSDLNIGKLWTVNYFFFNRKLKKMLLLTADAVSKLHLQNTHSMAYQQLHNNHRRKAGTGMDDEMDDDADYDEGNQSTTNFQGNTSHMVDGGDDDDDDDQLLENEEAMLDELVSEGVVGNGVAGNYVDVSLLEWDGMPAGTTQQVVESESDNTDVNTTASSNIYDSSPSTSSTTTHATVRLRPLPDAATASSIGAATSQRLASTRAPTHRGTAVAKSNLMADGQTPTIGGSQSHFTALAAASNPSNQ